MPRHSARTASLVTAGALFVCAVAVFSLRSRSARAQEQPATSKAAPTAQSNAAGSTDVVTLKSYIPGSSQGGVDAVTSFTQALQVVTPDVRVVQLPTPGQIALLGPPTSVRAARQFIDKVDIVPPLVVAEGGVQP